MVHLTLLVIALTTPIFTAAQADPAVTKPLAEKRFNYTNLPYKVDTDQNTQRGPQLGYNQCNSTTENQNSLCQVAMVIRRFVIFARDKLR